MESELQLICLANVSVSLCIKRGHYCSSLVQISKFLPSVPPPCPLTPLPVPFPVSWSVSLVTPPPWPYLVLKYHKVYWKSCTTGDISINLHIWKMCSVYWALRGNVGMQAPLSLLCQHKEVRAEQWTVSLQTEHLFVSCCFVDTVTQCTVCIVGGKGVTLCLKVLGTQELRWKNLFKTIFSICVFRQCNA